MINLTVHVWSLMKHLFSTLSTLKQPILIIQVSQCVLQNGRLAGVLLWTGATVFWLLHSCKCNLWDLVQWWLWALFWVLGLYSFSNCSLWGHECTLCWVEIHSGETKENSRCSCYQGGSQSLCDLERWSWIHCFIHVGNMETVFSPACWNCTAHFVECPPMLYIHVMHLSEALRPGTTDTACNMVPSFHWRYYPL